MDEPRPLRVAVFSTKPYDVAALSRANSSTGHELLFHTSMLDPVTAQLASEADVVCAFVHDDLGTRTIERLALAGIGLIALRSAGFNNVDLRAAREHDISVVRVPRYSPHAVAEHTMGLVLSLNRQIHRAYARVRENNFSIEGLLGFDLFGKTVGVVGTGEIGTSFARICTGMGMRVLASDPHPHDTCVDMGVSYVPLGELLEQSNIVSLHCPLTPETHHLINATQLSAMQDGVMLINTSRGGLIDTRAAIDSLKTGKIGYLGLDVYEEEEGLFFEDLSSSVIEDDVFSRLLTFPNVLITGHQAFFTHEALEEIAATTIESVSAYAAGAPLEYAV